MLLQKAMQMGCDVVVDGDLNSATMLEKEMVKGHAAEGEDAGSDGKVAAQGESTRWA